MAIALTLNRSVLLHNMRSWDEGGQQVRPHPSVPKPCSGQLLGMLCRWHGAHSVPAG